MSGIHYNVEAVELFCSQLRARREALAERLSDERVLYDAVFEHWKDHRAKGVQERLEELTRGVQTAAADLDDLIAALRRQIDAAREYLDGSEVW